MYFDFSLGGYYDLYASDFLDESDICDLLESDPPSEEDMHFWSDLMKG